MSFNRWRHLDGCVSSCRVPRCLLAAPRCLRCSDLRRAQPLAAQHHHLLLVLVRLQLLEIVNALGVDLSRGSEATTVVLGSVRGTESFRQRQLLRLFLVIRLFRRWFIRCLAVASLFPAA
jgi:hypothetical protein